MVKKYYAGIGSRQTPLDIQKKFAKLAFDLEDKGYVLRSGAADGADLAFEAGIKNPENKEIFLPWKGFNYSISQLYDIPNEAFKIAAQFHPAWDKLLDSVKRLHARNCQQVLGKTLDNPSKFVVCWTKNGEKVGGTAQALRIAEHYDIPIFNFGIKEYKLK